MSGRPGGRAGDRRRGGPKPQIGELYAITIRTRAGGGLRITQAVRAQDVLMMNGSAAVMFRFGQSRPGSPAMIDGPLSAAGWAANCRGRVVEVTLATG